MQTMSSQSEEQLEAWREDLLKNDPNSGDISEALMNRITALEWHVAQLYNENMILRMIVKKCQS